MDLREILPIAPVAEFWERADKKSKRNIGHLYPMRDANNVLRCAQWRKQRKSNESTLGFLGKAYFGCNWDFFLVGCKGPWSERKQTTNNGTIDNQCNNAINQTNMQCN